MIDTGAARGIRSKNRSTLFTAVIPGAKSGLTQATILCVISVLGRLLWSASPRWCSRLARSGWNLRSMSSKPKFLCFYQLMKWIVSVCFSKTWQTSLFMHRAAKLLFLNELVATRSSAGVNPSTHTSPTPNFIAYTAVLDTVTLKSCITCSSVLTCRKSMSRPLKCWSTLSVHVCLVKSTHSVPAASKLRYMKTFTWITPFMQT